MSKFIERLRDVHMFNAYDFARDSGRVFICYTPQDTGRSGHGASWGVHRIGYQTDPNGPWYHYGDKHFAVFMDTRAGALTKAQGWAGKKYGISEWARTPFGSWMDAGFVKSRLAELKKAIGA